MSVIKADVDSLDHAATALNGVRPAVAGALRAYRDAYASYRSAPSTEPRYARDVSGEVNAALSAMESAARVAADFSAWVRAADADADGELSSGEIPGASSGRGSYVDTYAADVRAARREDPTLTGIALINAVQTRRRRRQDEAAAIERMKTYYHRQAGMDRDARYGLDKDPEYSAVGEFILSLMIPSDLAKVVSGQDRRPSTIFGAFLDLPTPAAVGKVGKVAQTGAKVARAGKTAHDGQEKDDEEKRKRREREESESDGGAGR